MYPEVLMKIFLTPLRHTELQTYNSPSPCTVILKQQSNRKSHLFCLKHPIIYFKDSEMEIKSYIKTESTHVKWTWIVTYLKFLYIQNICLYFVHSCLTCNMHFDPIPQDINKSLLCTFQCYLTIHLYPILPWFSKDITCRQDFNYCQNVFIL